MGLSGYLLALTPQTAGSPSWLPNALAAAFVLATTAFVAGGLRRSNWGNAVLVGLALSGLLLFLLATSAQVSSRPEYHVRPTLREFLDAAALMFVAFAGYGRLATLGEEVREPAETIPQAVFITVGVTAVLYAAVAWAVDAVATHVPPETISATAAPLAALAEDHSRGNGTVGQLISAGACAALAGTLLNLLLGLSRVLLAMARRGEMPGGLAAVAGESPRRAVWAAGLGVAAVAGTGGLTLTWSVAACAVLLYYGLTNAAALQLPPESRRFPRAFAWVGLVGCASLAWFVTPVAAVVVAGWLLAGAAWRCGAVRLRAHRAERPAG